MTIKIYKNFHYPFLYFFIFKPLIFLNKKEKKFCYKFKFTKSCLYDLHNEDEHDVDKLFGFSVGHHHKNSSFRFGWRPILKNNSIQIVAYEYHNGKRQQTKIIGEVEINKWYTYTLKYNIKDGMGQYFITDEYNNTMSLLTISRKKIKFLPFGYKLFIYFGGNEKAPQDIVIYYKKCPRSSIG